MTPAWRRSAGSSPTRLLDLDSVAVRAPDPSADLLSLVETLLRLRDSESQAVPILSGHAAASTADFRSIVTSTPR
jgi:hypothetical protein